MREELFRRLVETTGEGIWVVNPQGRIIYANRRLGHLLGRSPETLRGLPASGLLGEAVSCSGTGDGAPLPEGESRAEFRLPQPDGSLRCLVVSSSPLLGEEGECLGTVGLFADVTDLHDFQQERGAEEALGESETPLHTVADALPVLLSYVGQDHRFRFVNRAYEEWFGVPPGEALGKHVREVIGERAYAAVRPFIEAALAGERMTFESRLEYKTGGERFISATLVPDAGPGGSVRGYVGLVTDLTERKRAEEAEQFLAEASALLASSLDYETTLANLAELCVPRLADFCIVDLLDGDGKLHQVTVAHVDPSRAESLRELHRRSPFGAERPYGVTRVLRTGQPELVSELSEAAIERFGAGPEHHRLLRELAPSSYMVVPLLVRGRVLGAVSFVVSVSGRRYDAVDLSRAMDLAHRMAVAVDNARLYQEAQGAELRLTFLADASELLASSLEYETTLANVARLAVPYLADWCTIHVAEEDGTLRQLALAHMDPEKVQWAESLPQRPPDPNAPRGLPNVLRTGRPELYSDIPDSLLAESARDDAELAILRQAGLRSAMIVPLQVGGRTLGAISLFMAESGRRYLETDLRLAEDLARRAGMAVDSARLYREVQEAARRKDEFLAMLAHELRNPLASVRNAVEVMEHGAPGLDVDRCREVIARQSDHMARLLDDLLDVSRITRDKIELRPELLDLRAVLEKVVEASRPLTASQRHTLTLLLPDTPVWVDADPTRIEQVLSNLLNNAAKYTEPGGRIELCLSVEVRGGDTGTERRSEGETERRREGETPRPHALGPEHLSTGTPGCPTPRAVLRVRDTGIGIPPEMLPHIFELFTQAHTSLDRAQGGLGIGLTLVRKLVELHGGRIEAFSDGPGRGSEFVVRLPVRRATGNLGMTQEPDAGSRAGPSAGPVRHSTLDVRPSRRVLLVDDNQDAAEMLGELVELWGHQVRIAHDGPRALAAAREFRPHVVLLDIGLPGMDGFEVARQLRRESPKSKVQSPKDVGTLEEAEAGATGAPDSGPRTSGSRPLLVALTGYGQEEDRRRSAEAGFDLHLVKPVDLRELRELLSSLGGAGN